MFTQLVWKEASRIEASKGNWELLRDLSTLQITDGKKMLEIMETRQLV